MEEMKKLIRSLNQYSYEYYTLGKPTISDTTYDGIYDKLVELENNTGIILSNSPTQKVGNVVLAELNKVTHEYPMLSLNKTKKAEDIKKFSKNKTLIAMDKLDGLTFDLTYNNGILIGGDSRGNGVIGENLLHNAKTFSNIPLSIPYKNKVHIIGEAIIDYNTFNNINSKLPQDKQYKNPRNLVSGTVRQLNSSICKDRNVRFIGYIVEGNSELKTKQDQIEFIRGMGFEPVNYYFINKEDSSEDIEIKLLKAKNYANSIGIPIDGEVVSFNDIEYGKSLGNTANYPLNSLAFKFVEDSEISILRNVEWQVGRTGVVTPVLIFDTVELAGTEVSKASAHNLSILKSLQLGVGDEISVVKKNEIIPQVIDNLTKSNTLEIPNICPVCGEHLIVKNDTDSEFLYCSNSNCKAKLIQSISHYCSRDAMNIIGLSEKTIEKFIEKGFIKSIIDIYSLEQYKNEIVKLDGFGLKSYNKLIDSIEKSKQCKLENFIYALGLPNVGRSTAKNMVEYCTEDDTEHTLDNIQSYYTNEWLGMKDCGEVLANSIPNWFKNQYNYNLWYTLIDELTFKQKETAVQKEGVLTDKILYLTGTFAYGKKKDLKELVENNGGTFSEKFNKSCDYLVIGSLKGSSKGDKAIKMGIEVLTEEQFLNMTGGVL